MKHIGIVGTRRRDSQKDYLTVSKAFWALYQPGDVIVSGGCKQGADRFAELLAEQIKDTSRVRIIRYLPDRSLLDPVLYAQRPRAALARINHARNTLIAADSDILLACVAEDRKGGAENTIEKFRRRFPEAPAGVPCTTEKQLIQQGLLVLV